MIEQSGASTLLLPLDGTAESKSALLPARAAAEILNAALHVLHVTAEPLSIEAVVEKLQLSPEERRGLIFHQTTGDPSVEILPEARKVNAGLIVMATHGGPATPGTLGSVAEEIVQEANCPVLTVRPEAVAADVEQLKRLRRILVPLDGTPTSALAVKPAAELARRRNAELLILHIATAGVPPPKEPGTLTVGRYMDQPQHEWPLWATEFVQRFCLAQSELVSQLSLRLHLAHGAPAAEIVQFAAGHGVDLIVTAWHGRFAQEHAPVVKRLLHKAPCPVLIVRAAEDTTPCP